MRYIIRLFFFAVAASLFTTVRATAQTLQSALDATNLTWTASGTGGDFSWFPETNDTHDGVSAAETYLALSPGEEEDSILQTTVTGPGTLTFWCYTPDTGGGELLFSVSNLTETIFTDTPTTQQATTFLPLWQQWVLMPSWQQAVYYIGSGTQTLTWTYTNVFGIDLSVYPADLDQVSWVTGTTAPIVTNQPLSQSQVPGMNTTFSVGAGGTPPLSYQWYFNSNAIPGATSASYTVSNVQAADLGYYSVAITNIAGSNCSANASLEFGNITGWGDNAFFETSIPPGTTNVIGISAGAEQNLALKADGSLLAWGLNDFGQLSIPPNLSNVIAVAENSFDSMAITAGGSLIEWGNNSGNQINVAKTLTNVIAVASGVAFDTVALKSVQKPGYLVGTVVDPGRLAIYVPPSFRTNVVAVASGYDNSLALESDGGIDGWGESMNLLYVPLYNAVAIAMGDTQCIALKPDGTIEEWNQYPTTLTNAPPGLSNVVAIAAGWEHFLALKADGTVVAWGDNTFGQTNVPAGLSNVVAIAAGQDHNIVLVGNGPPVMSAPIQNPTLSSNGISFSIPSQSGRVYELEYKNNITDTNWTPLPLVTGNGTNLIMTDPTATNSQRFYRVQRW